MEYDYTGKDGAATSENNLALVVRSEESQTLLGKRQAVDSTNLGSSRNPGEGMVANIVDRFELSNTETAAVATVVTPQENKNRKKPRTEEDGTNESVSKMDDENDANQMISAAS